MPLTVDSPFIPSDGKPRISEGTFTNVLMQAGSPWTHRAGELYDRIVAAGQDPAVWLAIAGREHTYGSNRDSVLWRNDTRSWTNARTVRDPSLTNWSIIRDPVRGSEYVKYNSVLDSVRDGLYRITDPTHRYVREGRKSIGQVFDIWTEGDGPDYAAFVVRKVNEWMAEDTGVAPVPVSDRAQMLQLLNAQFPLPYRVSHIPAGNPNRPGGPLVTGGEKWITVHETGNPKVGANAEMHRRFTHNGGGTDNVSFTYVVDDHEAIELLPRWEKSWQASDGPNGIGNSSESIETCVNSDGDWTKTRENLSRLIARAIIVDPENSPDRIAQHNTWARDGKNCPTRMRANGGREWNAMVAGTREILTAVGYFGSPTPADDRILVEGNPFGAFGYRLGFKGRLQQIGAAVSPSNVDQGILAWAGWPTEDEWLGVDGCTYQRAERVILKYEPGVGHPFDVVAKLRNGDPLPERKK